jgi:type IV pilus assembly protein PilE
MNNIQQFRSQASWRGFTLIELMVVLAVFAILSTIAVGSYRSYTLRATRTEGRLALLAIQVAQEKYFLQNNQYAQDIATVIAAPPAGLGISTLSAAGVTSGGNYTISFSAVTPTTYTLQAVATGNQTKDTAACLTFTITDQGARTPADSSGCWR